MRFEGCIWRVFEHFRCTSWSVQSDRRSLIKIRAQWSLLTLISVRGGQLEAVVRMRGKGGIEGPPLSSKGSVCGLETDRRELKHRPSSRRKIIADACKPQTFTKTPALFRYSLFPCTRKSVTLTTSADRRAQQRLQKLLGNLLTFVPILRAHPGAPLHL
jgi:hypothetical protein